MITRFAPSPTGRLHLGHAYSAMLGHDMARAAGGRFLLRIEDTDHARCRPEFEAAIYDDLQWLGLDWPVPVLRQSDHLARYADAMQRLTDMGLCYACGCSRADIAAAQSAPQEGVAHLPPDGAVYPGTCRGKTGITHPNPAIRLDLDKALLWLGNVGTLGFTETGPEMAGLHHLDPATLRARVGDVVLSRRDIGTAAYHLCVVLDDALQGITHIVRGMDLFEATQIHRLLQALLELSTPTYHHHRLIRDENGKRLAKRDDARAIRQYRDAGLSPQDIRQLVGLG